MLSTTNYSAPEETRRNDYLLINGEQVKSCPCFEGVDRWAYVAMKTAVNFYKGKQQEASQRAVELQEKLTQIARCIVY